jgi:hypothetical protein
MHSLIGEIGYFTYVLGQTKNMCFILTRAHADDKKLVQKHHYQSQKLIFLKKL